MDETDIFLAFVASLYILALGLFLWIRRADRRADRNERELRDLGLKPDAGDDFGAID